MNSLLFDDISTSVENLYNNLFLLALDRNYNLQAIVQDVSEHIDEYYENTDVVVPRGFEGILFVMAVTKSMRASLTDVLYMSNVEKKLIVYNLIKEISKDEIISEGNNFFNDEDIIKFQYLYMVQDNAWGCTYYELCFTKAFVSEKKYSYSIEIKFIFDEEDYYEDNDLMYNCAVIWSEETGEVVDFIDTIIENMEDEYEEDADNEIEHEEEEKNSIEKNDSNIVVERKNKEVLDEKTGKRIIDELVTYIFNDTRTVSLLDEFEGYDEGEPVYRRLVIKNNKYAWVLKLKNYAGINLVIERSRNRDYVGDITFTEFKQDNDRDLREFIKSEITDEIVDKYLDKDQFYRFSKPYRLRAQNRKNRTGYGWEWDWSGGYGDYIEGTLYGETTDYVFVGAYISSMYNSYDPEDRKPFVEHTFNSSLKQENINLVPYSGKLTQYIDRKLVQRFIKVVATNGKYKYLPTSYDEQEQTAYIIDSAYNKYCEQLKGEIVLVKTIID